LTKKPYYDRIDRKNRNLKIRHGGKMKKINASGGLMSAILIGVVMIVIAGGAIIQRTQWQPTQSKQLLVRGITLSVGNKILSHKWNQDILDYEETPVDSTFLKIMPFCVLLVDIKNDSISVNRLLELKADSIVCQIDQSVAMPEVNFCEQLINEKVTRIFTFTFPSDALGDCFMAILPEDIPWSKVEIIKTHAPTLRPIASIKC
jgi:hypothetical protein